MASETDVRTIPPDVAAKSNEELSRAWNAGMIHQACSDAWTTEHDTRLRAIEAEIERREKAGLWQVAEDD